jgi:hypothetical protein
MTTFLPEVREIVQFAVETTPGVLVPANKIFSSMLFDIDPKKPTAEVRQSGNLFPVDHVPGKGHTEFSAKGEAAVQDLIYALSTLLSVPVFTADGSIAHKATFTPDSRLANAKQTLSIEKGQSGTGNASFSGYGAFNNVELDFVPDRSVSVTGKGLAQTVDYGQTLTAGAAQLGTSVLFPTDVDIYIATSEAGLSAGAFPPLALKVKFDKFLQDVYELRSDIRSFSGLVEVAPNVTYELTFAKNADSIAFIDAIDTNTLYYIEVIAKGAQLDTGIYDQFRARSPINHPRRQCDAPRRLQHGRRSLAGRV